MTQWRGEASATATGRTVPMIRGGLIGREEPRLSILSQDEKAANPDTVIASPTLG
jgi:hypothetical protein